MEIVSKSSGFRAAVLLGCCAAAWAAVSGCKTLPIQLEMQSREGALDRQDRILILAPHPDDEVLGCGGVIQHAVGMGIPVRIVFLTHGDNNEWSFMVHRKRPVLASREVRRMGLIRRKEAFKAAEILGVPAREILFLGYPDFGVLNIWTLHWGDRPAYRSMLTRARAVPYKNAFRPGAAYKGEEVLRDLETVIREFRPTKIFISHPADRNSDHRALYLFTRVALWNLEKELKPQVYPYLIHFPRWPRPAGDHPSEPSVPPKDLQRHSQWRRFLLTPVEVERKKRALQAHQTQFRYNRRALLSFVRRNELFGESPEVDLHAGDSPVGLTVRRPPKSEASGFQSKFVWLEENNLVLEIEFSHPLEENVYVSLHVFGYRSRVPFSQMPKLHIRMGAFGSAVYDQKKREFSHEIKVIRKHNKVTIRVPLEALGYPERVLTGARMVIEKVPLDWLSWRVLRLDE